MTLQHPWREIRRLTGVTDPCDACRDYLVDEKVDEFFQVSPPYAVLPKLT